jgi:hypothetical protein
MATTLLVIGICILLATILGIVILIIPSKKMLIIEKWIKAWRGENRTPA